MSAVIGIDFDTLYLTAACYDGRVVTLVRDDRGETRIPAVLTCTDGGREVFGRDALELAQRWTGRLLVAPARLLQFQSQGRHEGDITHFLDGFAVIFELQPDGQIVVRLRTQTYALQVACVILLGELKRLAERDLQSPVDACAITVPDYGKVHFLCEIG